MNRFCVSTLLGILAAWAVPAGASSLLPFTTAAHYDQATRVVRGTVVANEGFRGADHGIYTRTTLRLSTSFKGAETAELTLVHRGGVMGEEAEDHGWSPALHVGEERLFFLIPRDEETYQCIHGAPSAVRLTGKNGRPDPGGLGVLAEVTRRSGRTSPPPLSADGNDPAYGPQPADTGCGEVPGGTYGLSVGAGAIPGRFTAPDRGEPIPYLVDATVLPTGLTPAQGLAAVSNALAAWTAVSSLRFQFEGLQSFGMAAGNVNSNDFRLRIQLHDSHGFIPGTQTLGIGGRVVNAVLLPGAGWGQGGNVAGQEFYRTQRGYVTLKHTSATMQNLTTFTEVLTHEVGHALGLSHSSETATNDACLADATMFWQVHADGRGATLREWDIAVINKAHPSANPPPWSYDRVLDVVTSPDNPTLPGINEVELRGYDLKGDALSLELTNRSEFNGTFALNENSLRFIPAGYFADSQRYDPGGNPPLDRLIFRFSDGVNASPYARFNVVSLSEDAYPVNGTDGIPDRWMLAYFGNANPAAGPNRGALQDGDGDGLNNRTEFRTGMNPLSAASAQRITAVEAGRLQWQAVAYELYEVLGSTNLQDWQRVVVSQPTNASLDIRTSLPQTNILATLSNLPTSGPRFFYRVVKVP